MLKKIKTKLKRVENNKLWQFLIITSVFVSIFGPPTLVLMKASATSMLELIFWSNILFIVDSLIKLLIYGKSYLLSIDIIIDTSAIVSAVMEFLFVLGMYSGPAVANLRIVRVFKLVGRMSRGIKTIINFGKISKTNRNINTLYYSEETRSEELIFVNKLKSKLNTIFMLLMSYIILRYSSTFEALDDIATAKAEIKFFFEIIIIIAVAGFFIDHYLNVLLSERLKKLIDWVNKKSQENIFFKEVHKKALNSYDEVHFLERYIGIIFERLNEFPYALRKFVWGRFKPTARKRIIFLSDMEKYSSRTANMPPEKINDFLDAYVKEIVNIITRYNGEIDKYIGDSVIAFFDINDADKALLASIEITRIKIKTRIGLHMDTIYETAVGPHGYKQIDHISEGISIAQRLEEHNKKTRTQLLISQEVYTLLSEHIKSKIKYLGRFKPKGARRIIKYYGLRKSR